MYPSSFEEAMEQVRRVALPEPEEPLVFQEWWEVLVFDDPHLAKRPTDSPEGGE
ncbi:hypothetical protein ABZ896_22070 [Streptomyces sp. NPDC047072]|uniref:hypothetical protein n=1 Tax=Streptomyces sp. NPDC047072 TaxID=3154809 RepID=UPI0033D72C52